MIGRAAFGEHGIHGQTDKDRNLFLRAVGQPMGSKSSSVVPTNFGAAPLTAQNGLESTRLRIWGSGVRIFSGAPIKSNAYMGTGHPNRDGLSSRGPLADLIEMISSAPRQAFFVCFNPRMRSLVSVARDTLFVRNSHGDRGAEPNFGGAPRSGRRGRRFKSCRSDHNLADTPDNSAKGFAKRSNS